MAVESSSTTTTVVHPSSPASIGLLLARVPLGLYFLVAGISKFIGEKSISGFVERELPRAERFMSANLSRNFLTSLPFIEVAVGILLIAGLLTRVTAGIVSLLLISFVIALEFKNVFKIPFHPNLVFLGTALAIMLCGPGSLSVDRLLFRPRRRITATDDYVDPALRT